MRVAGRFFRQFCFSLPVVMAWSGAASAASTTTVTFEGLAHGEIVTEQYSSLGLHISAENYNNNLDIAVAFDTNLTSTRDPDLEDPWDFGNLPSNTDLGNVLILQEWVSGLEINNGIVNKPDDEGARPAGYITFEWDTPIFDLGFDLVDVESQAEEPGYIRFYNGGTYIGQVPWSAFLSFGTGIEFGNNSANTIRPLTTADIAGITDVLAFDKVKFKLGGSGSIDNLNWTNPDTNVVVPEPSSFVLMGLGATGVFWFQRRQSRRRFVNA